jgi:DNA-binding transcriptional LysR family regulator
MIDWDDVRYFLAVARGGSVRAAAERVGVNHATVLRRVAQLEQRLGAYMFEKLPSGCVTAAGEEVLELAEQMEASSLQLETRVFGRDTPSPLLVSARYSRCRNDTCACCMVTARRRSAGLKFSEPK